MGSSPVLRGGYGDHTFRVRGVAEAGLLRADMVFWCIIVHYMKDHLHPKSQSTPQNDDVATRRSSVHKLNELLTVIAGYAELSRGLVARDSQVFAYLDEIDKAADQAARLAHQLSPEHNVHPALLHSPVEKESDSSLRTSLLGVNTGLGSRRILLVDDEPAVRKFTSAILAMNGYEVTAVASGAEAFAACEDQAGGFGLVISDVLMPGISGVELMEQLLARWPQIRVLLMSGFPGVEVPLLDTLGRRVPFVSKPYTNLQLLGEIRMLLDVI